MAVSFVAASAVVTGANPTVVLPSGVVEKDLLLLITTGTATPTTPAGWTQRSAQGNNNFLTIIFKFATGTEAASVALTQAGASTNAVILVYRGASAIDTVSGFTNNAAGTSLAPGQTGNTQPNDCEITVYAANNVAGTWGAAPSPTTSRVSSNPNATVNGLLIVDETQAAAGASTARTGTITGTHLLSAVAIAVIPSGRYWVGGTGTWTTTTTNWSQTSGGASGAPAPTINDPVFFDQVATYTVTLTGGLNCFGMTVSAGTVTFTSTGTITNSGSISLIAGTVWSATGLLTFNSTSSGRTITTNALTISSPITFNGVGGVWTLSGALSSTAACTLTSGSIDYNGYSITTTTTFTYSGGTFVNGPYITCATFTLSGPTLTLNSPYQISPSTSFVITSGSFTYNGGTLGTVPTFTQTAGNVTFNQNYSLTVTGTYTLTAGTLTLANGVTLGTGIFSSTGAGTRSIAFGSTGAGNINLTHTTAATVVLNMAALGGFSYTGTGGFTVADMSNTRTFSVGNTSGGSLTTAPNLTFTTGASIATLTTASWYNNLNFGTTSFAIAATSLNIVKSISLSTGGTYTALTLTIQGTASLYNNGKSITAMTIGSATNAGSLTLLEALTMSGAFTLTQGTILCPYNITSGSFASAGALSKTMTGTNITYTVTGAGATAFSNTGTGLTMNGFIINMTSASAKTFAGGGGTYPVLNNGGAGALTISGSNTFDTISNSVQPTTFTFTIATTQTVNNFDVDGIAGSLVTINSSTAATAATLSKASGIVYGAYLSIRDSTATGGATWYAGPTSTNTSNNTGWIFTQLPIITMGNLTVADGGFVISNDPVVFA